MRRGVAGDALELAGEVDDPLDARIRLVHLAQWLRDFQRLVELDPELVRHGLGDPVDLAVAVAQDPAHVADGGPGQHRAEGDDLGDVVVAVLAGDVGDDLVPPAVLEVDVDVRHRHPVRVEEPLERQLVEDRVDRGDAQRVGHDRARRAAPARRLDPLLAGEADEVGDDQEVAGVAHGGDDAQLVLQACPQQRRHLPVASLQASLALLAQPALRGLTVGHREVRDAQVAQRHRDVALLGNPARVADRLRLVREEGRHLGRRLEPEVVGFELQPAGRVEVVAGPHAQQDVVGLGLVLVDVVQVVGDDQRQANLRGQAEELLVEPSLLGQAVILELEEEAVLAEDLAVFAGQAPRALPVVDLEGARDFAVQAGGKPDQALAVPGQVLAVDAGLVVVAVDMGVGHEPAQVAVAGPVLGQQDEVEGLGVGLALLVGHRPPGDVGLDADDRLDALGRRRLVERDGAIERAVVGQGQRVEALLCGRIDEVGDAAQPVEEAELRVHMEMRKIVWGDGRHGRSMVAARPRRRRPRGCPLPED